MLITNKMLITHRISMNRLINYKSKRKITDTIHNIINHNNNNITNHNIYNLYIHTKTSTNQYLSSAASPKHVKSSIETIKTQLIYC